MEMVQRKERKLFLSLVCFIFVKMAEYIGKNVLVTGANRGLGLSFVQYLLKDYPEVKLLFAGTRDPSKSEKLQKLKEKHGDSLQIIQLDVSSDSSIEQAFKIVEEKLNGEGLDLLINNAGVALFEGNSPKEPKRDVVLNVYNVNVVGTAIVTSTFIPLLNKSVELNKRPVKIVNISSHLAIRAYNQGIAANNDFAYGASKSALSMYSHILAKSPYASEFVVLAMAPGHVQTDMGGNEAPLTVDDSIPKMLKITAKATKEQSGVLIDLEGKVWDI